MCLIIQKPAGQTIPTHVIESAAMRNSDGTGIMVGGRFDKWLDIKPERVKEKTDALKDKDVGVHFRMATDGAVDRKRAHPFLLADGTLLMHNGVLGGYRAKAKDKDSDTVNFINRFVNPHIKKNGALCPETVSDAAGYSAFLLMQKDGGMERFGSGWCEHYGLHFSNTYAWASPSNYNKGSGYSGYWSDINKAGGNYTGLQDDIDDQNYLAGEQLRLLLADWVDQINPGYTDVSYSDGDMLDQVFYGQITMTEFIACCDSESLLKLFAVLAREFGIARHI